jgi:pSer/pThr/pTyr-binding forkhead associated (FHA) protein
VRICPFCSTENEAFFRFCLGCGADLDEALGADDEVGPDTNSLMPRPKVDESTRPSPRATNTGNKPPKAVEPAPIESLLPDEPLAAVQAIPKPRVSSKDTSVDMPVITDEMFEQMKAPAKKAQSTAGRGVEPARPVTATPGSPPPRVAQSRDKTLDPGGAVKPGSAASQAVAQAQNEIRRPAAPTEQVGSIVPAAAVSVDQAADAADVPAVATNPKTVKPQASASPIAATVPKPARKAELEAPAVPVDGSTKRSGSPPDVVPPAAKRQGKSKARLVIILEDGTDGAILDLTPDTTVVGREGVDISFPHDDFLAKRHAELSFVDGTLFLKPLESTNGVFLQVHQEVELDNGDIFRIGQQLLVFEMLSMVATTLNVDPKGQAIPLGSPVPDGAWGRLGQLIAPDTLGSVYLLGGNEVYLGRERGDITFPGDGFVSGLHAQISMRNGRCFLKDLGSSNGTYLRLSKATAVKRGMLVLAGQQLFRVES